LISHALDANAAISLLNGKSDKLAQRLFAQAAGSVALPTIVAQKLYWGAFRSHHVQRNLENLHALARELPFLDFDANDARAAGEIGAAPAACGAPIGPYDVLIAGQAKARGLVLVTNNLKQFHRVAGLTVEDWTR
jgi:tRNA(fMet)-specific endonuclease VapC